MKTILSTAFALLSAASALAQSADLDENMRRYGLVDIRSLYDGILVELRYSTEDNFVGRDMYGDLETAYLLPHFARKVVEAQRLLKELHPEYTLLIYDAARPISVQRTMRRMVEGTPNESFVADGSRGGRHNYGVAVDLTIARSDGRPIDMGTDTDQASTRTIEVYREYISSLARSGIISDQAAANRILLIEVMCQAGLVPYRREWWHFEEIISMPETRRRYRLLDF